MPTLRVPYPYPYPYPFPKAQLAISELLGVWLEDTRGRQLEGDLAVVLAVGRTDVALVADALTVTAGLRADVAVVVRARRAERLHDVQRIADAVAVAESVAVQVTFVVPTGNPFAGESSVIVTGGDPPLAIAAPNMIWENCAVAS